MISPARVAACDIGLAVATDRLDLADAVAASRRTVRDDRDKALAAEIAIGVQRWRAALDHLIIYYSKRPLDRLDREVVEILRLTAYQLLFLTRVPVSAAVDDGVKLTGRVGKRSAAGLVNAVLRAVSRDRTKIRLPASHTQRASALFRQSDTDHLNADTTYDVHVLPARPTDPADRKAALDYLSITLSHPRWLVERWLTRYGFEATETWLMFNNSTAPLTLRPNGFRNDAYQLIERLAGQGVIVRRGRYVSEALIVEHGRPLGGLAADEGWFVVQDEASQLVTLLAGTEPGRCVLDTCASPGGKTTALATRIPKDGLIVACDVRDRRIDLLVRTIRRTGASKVRVVQADLLQPLPFSRAFDCVFVDAPCSGLGTLRRDPDIKWRRREGDLSGLASSQVTMLRHAAAVVRPGGRLVYATCSSEPEENEGVAAAFVSSTSDFLELDARDAASSLPIEVVDTAGRLRTYPHLHGLEAFFGAVFVRRE
jgi:16S rRNA (cytosine967-C5)-methyltransferase